MESLTSCPNHDRSFDVELPSLYTPRIVQFSEYVRPRTRITLPA